MAAGGLILVGDIGGTNSRLAVTASDHFALRHQHVYESPNFANFEAILAEYLRQAGISGLTGACIAVAGPVVDGTFRLTNIPHWHTSSTDTIKSALGVGHVHLINDFEAVGHSIAHLSPSELVPVGGGVAKSGYPVMAIGPGTGLGMCYIVTAPDGRKIVQTAEPGPGSLPIQTARELAIATHVRGQNPRLFNEALVSGGGLLGMYRAIAAIDGLPAPLTESAQVSHAALAGSDAAAVAALDQFLVWFGRIAGDLALFLRAEGGVYLGGGIAPKILPRLLNGPFRAAFEDKEPLSHIPKGIPVHVIMAEFPGLRGCAAAFTHAFPSAT